MTATLIDGRARAAALRARVKDAAALFAARAGRAPGLAVVLVGADPASEVYVRSKGRATVEAGMVSREIRLDAATTEAELLAVVAGLNADPAIDGILVQLPLPRQIDANLVIAAIDPAKDVDGFHPINVGRLWLGQDALVPCTPTGCVMLARETLPGLSGLNAVVVGRSNIVGKPVAALLLAESCTVSIAHSRTADLPALCRSADILVAAVGVPEMIKGDWIKPGATVIDVGTSRVIRDGQQKLVGDVEFASAAKTAGAITPVPGGVGPMTIMTLMHNTLLAAYRRNSLADPAL